MSQVATQNKAEGIASTGFDYGNLERSVAARVQTSVARIRKTVKQSVDALILIGEELLEVKAALPHGTFGRWLLAEFGWSERTARNFMSVAEQFGKSASIADLAIQPTAAYFLAAPSVPEEAREQAIRRARAGEPITTKVAKEIVLKSRKRLARKKTAPPPTKKLELRLQSILRQYKGRWDPRDLTSLLRLLREFIAELETSTQEK